MNVQEYNPSSNKDRFENTAWTLNGRIGVLKAVYTGAFLDHNVSEIQDYTAYARGAFAAYYQCNGPSLPRGTGTQNVCYSPSTFWQDTENNTHQTHEMRLSTPDGWRARGILGLFWEDYRIKDDTGWFYASPEAGFFGQAPPPASTRIDPGVRPNGDVENNSTNMSTRGYKQKAAFGEVSMWTIVPRRLTLSVGTRVYSIETFERGSSNSGYGCRWVPAGQCQNGNNLDADYLDKTL